MTKVYRLNYDASAYYTVKLKSRKDRRSLQNIANSDERSLPQASYSSPLSIWGCQTRGEADNNVVNSTSSWQAHKYV